MDNELVERPAAQLSSAQSRALARLRKGQNELARLASESAGES